MESSRKKRSRGSLLGWSAVVTLVVVLALSILLPLLLVRRDLPVVRYDFTRHLGVAAHLVTNRTLKARFRLVDFSLLPRPLLNLRAKIALEGTPFEVSSEVDWKLGRGWILSARLPDVSVDEQNPLLAHAVDRMVRPLVPDLEFGGRVSGTFEAARTNDDGIVRWKAQARIRDFSVQGTQEDVSAEIQRLDCRLAASGLADHYDLEPIRLRIASACFNHLQVSNIAASAVLSESKLLVTEASAGFCGGLLRLYSLALDMNRSSLWATVLAEDLEAGEVLKMVRGFQGTATGRLHGKLRFGRDTKGLLRFRDAYLYSIPGEQGSLKMTDSGDLLASVADGCLGEADRRNLERALSNLDYSALKVRLDKASREDSTLNFKINGSVGSDDIQVPVCLDITCRGSIEQLINTGLNFNNKRR